MDLTFIISVFLFILFVTVVLIVSINYFTLLPESTTIVELRDKTKTVFDIFFGRGGIATREKITFDLARTPLLLTESSGVARTNQIAYATIDYDDVCINKTWNTTIRIYDQQFNELPSKISYKEFCTSQYLNRSLVTFLVNMSANEKKTVYVYYTNNSNITGALHNITITGYWPLDEGTGTLAKDHSGNNNNGTLFNGVAWTTGIYGNAVQLDGTNDYVNVSDSRSMNITINNLTLSAWVKLTGTTGGASTGRIISKTAGSGSEQYELMYTTNSHGAPNKFRFDVRTLEGLKSVYTNNTYTTTNTWIHVTGLYNSTHLSIFVNGSQLNATTQTESITGRASDVNIGRAATGTDFFNGTIDDVRIYNGTLTASEISALATSSPLTVNILPEENITAISSDKFKEVMGRSYNDVRTAIGEGWNFRVEIRENR